MTADRDSAPLDLPATYDAAATEAAIYARWQDAGVFTAQPRRTTALGGDRDPFVMLMPPPNVTAVLHMGHGLNNTVQDVLVALARACRGDEALWLPGTDHAGIATQNVVEKQLAARGRQDALRPRAARRSSRARPRSSSRPAATILQQLARDRRVVRLDAHARTRSRPSCQRAVREAFVRLHERRPDLPAGTASSTGARAASRRSPTRRPSPRRRRAALYHITLSRRRRRRRARITVATTRPETMLGDVAVAVHPDDERYRDLIGRTVTLPIVDRRDPRHRRRRTPIPRSAPAS